MDWVRLALIVELIIVLSAPPVYQYYLWRRGKTTPAQLKKTLKVFLPFYIGIFAILIALAVSQGDTTHCLRQTNRA